VLVVAAAGWRRLSGGISGAGSTAADPLLRRSFPGACWHGWTVVMLGVPEQDPVDCGHSCCSGPRQRHMRRPGARWAV